MGLLTSEIAAQETAPLNVENIIEEALEAFNVPGVAVGIVADGKVVLAKGYGFRNVEAELPVTENTLFAIGSCTKAFTAFLLAQLVEEGKLSWDDPVIQHIPEFRLSDPYITHQLTIRDLAAHRAGLPRHDLLWLNKHFTRSELFRVLPHLDFASGLREKFQYNNLLYTVAGIVVERVTGQTWEEALNARILTPLEMLNSTTTKTEGDFSLPYATVEGVVKAIQFRDLHAVAPAGAINSSASDMVKWIQMQLAEGTPLLGKESLKETHTIQMPCPVAAPNEEVYHFGYGLGWVTGNYRGRYYLHHGGGIDGYISQVSLLPNEKIGVVVLSNGSSGGGFAVATITNTIIDHLLGENGVDWLQKWKTQQEQIEKITPEAGEAEGTPSHPLEEYAGSYHHPAYGTVRVSLEGGRLTAYYGEISIPLKSKCYDIFTGKTNQEILSNYGSIAFSFASNTSGEICELSIPFEVKPVLFKRKAESALFSKDYLKQFEGVYGEAPFASEVLLKGDKLMMVSAGVEFELIPEKKMKFSLKGYPGHTVEFGVEQMIYTHPLAGQMIFKRNSS